MTKVLTLEDLDLESLRGLPVFVRVDFNVPLEAGRVTDDTRLEAALPTLDELSRAGAKLLLASHLGRPAGEHDLDFSLRPVAERLGELWGREVDFVPASFGNEVRAAVSHLEPGGACLLENLRFHAGEKANDPGFAAALAEPAVAYVNDAFGTAHRGHASVVGVPGRLERRAAGRLLAREIEVLGELLEAPERPFAALIGGAKIEGKADTLVNLLPRLDRLILGGAMANTFLAAAGHDMASSLVEPDRIELAREIVERARTGGVEVTLPVDLVVTDDLESPGRVENVAVDRVPEGTMAVDVGEASRAALAAALDGAKTLFWNGPMGVFERPPFDAGSLAAAKAVVASGARAVVGGGETGAVAARAGIADKLFHVSTGGGAALELLAGKTLPGVEALARGGDR